MAVLKKVETDRQLRVKMSGECDSADGDHHFYFFKLDGREVLRTKISRPLRGDLDDHLIGLMAKQLKLTSGDFRQYIECTLSAEEWRVHLTEKAGEANRHV